MSKKAKIINVITPRDNLELQKRIARAAYDANPTIENLQKWIQSVNACKLVK